MTRLEDTKKPIPKILPYYRLLDEKARSVLQEFYEDGKVPEPHILSMLQKSDIPDIEYPYTKDRYAIVRWIQQWMPKMVWGSRTKVKRWCDSKEDI